MHSTLLVLAGTALVQENENVRDQATGDEELSGQC
jgi:hypothetical protein